LRSYFKEIYKIEKIRYNDIQHIKLDRWHSKKRRGKIDSFGRIEVKINDTERFNFLIQTSDLVRLVKILETHRFQSKVHRSRSRDELLLVFPSSPHFSET
jgi:hypothetical protein